MGRRGFTLIELLIVMMIIVILMGLLFPAIHMIRERAKVAKTLTLVQKIQSACEMYRNNSGGYPDSKGIADVLCPGLTAWEATPLPHTTAPPSPLKISDPALAADTPWTTIDAELLTFLQKVGRDDFTTITVLADAWNHPLRYRPARYYPWLQGAPKPVVDSDKPPQPDSYQLWSTGSNEKDEFGEPDGDDVTGWSK
jgi:prepilin-type N-terminal cleavage/methylation domain-containing protein